MKQKDIVVIIIAGFIAAIASLIITQMIFVDKDSKNMTAQKVDKITAQFNEPDKNVFNDKAINPTQLIQIGDSNNSNPF